jgi:hypothetical protein
MSRKKESDAYSDIQPPEFFAEKKQRKPKRVEKEKAHEKFKAMHDAVDIERHLRALRE